MADEGIEDRAYRLRNSVSQVCAFFPSFTNLKYKQLQTDDYALTGSVLGALLTTTLFLRRLPIWLTIISGLALGIDGGILTHLIVHKSNGSPNAMIAEIKESYPLKADAEAIAAGDGDKVIKGQ